MKHRHQLQITTPDENIRVVGLVNIEHQSRLAELLTGEEKVAADFTVRGLTILLKTKAGSLIILKEGK